MRQLRTQVGIVGAGPAGLLLSHLLAREGVESIVLERRSREYVEQRVRAGVLEHSTAEFLDACGLGERLRREGLVHHGIELRFGGERHRMPLTDLAGGRSLVVYGQQEVVKDLIAVRLGADGDLRFDVEVTGLEGFDGTAGASGGSGGSARIHFRAPDGEPGTLSCEVIAGCDGSHGAARTAVTDRSRVHTREYPYAWLGILAAAAPSTDELIYCRSDRGFALYSMRSPEISRLYLQVPPGEPLERWSDERIWDELRCRLQTRDGWSLSEGPILERSMTTMRAVMVESMRFGTLFLAGDAAHVVPPTGAKGMNLAVADVRDLAEVLVQMLNKSDDTLADHYSARCLMRAWRAQEFSSYMTTMLHPLTGDEFGNRLQLGRLDHLMRSDGVQRWLAECYVDLTGS
ncbi:MAG: 4-hydroxybenzoate 3-monooxygenase [Acidimicrobiales bacterium]